MADGTRARRVHGIMCWPGKAKEAENTFTCLQGKHILQTES